MSAATLTNPRPRLAAASRAASARPRHLAALLLAVAVLLTAVGGAATDRATLVPVVVEAATHAEARAVLADHGATDIVVLPDFGIAMGRVPTALVDDVETDHRVRSASPDRPMQPTSAEHVDARAASVPAATVGAPQVWAQGADGSGVTVALMDTGIAPHPDLAERLVAVLDISGEQDGAAPDGHGHGTFLAGIVAGGGERPVGIAPGAELVSVKVADAEGRTSLSQVLAGLHAVSRFQQDLSIDVLLVALGSDWPGERDPLDAALERLWHRGVFVVTAAGNEGPEDATVTTPGDNATVLTVGASNDVRTADRADDTVAPWSAAGIPGSNKPELVAPGVSIESLRVPGSVIDEAFPDARVGEDRFRGSGTSMSAAVAAGAAALLLDLDPSLTPDQVKQRLIVGAAPAPAGGTVNQVGAGSLDVVGAVDAAPLSVDATHPVHHGNADRGGGAPSASDPAAWTWKAWTWKAWTWKAWTWKAWTWKAWTWKAWTWKAWTWR